jgi:hypothetical protein
MPARTVVSEARKKFRTSSFARHTSADASLVIGVTAACQGWLLELLN